MTTTDDAKELIQTTKNEASSTKLNDKAQTKSEAPLMRYFDLVDDSGDCYVLGYN